MRLPAPSREGGGPWRARSRSAGVALLAATLASGCGGDDGPEPAPRPVRVQVVSPADATVVRGASIELRGTVRPSGADVRVLGRDVDVRDGSWVTEVSLRPGGNVVDVTAALPGRAPAVDAVRIVRMLPVEVPDVRELTPAEARDVLAARGLEVTVEERGGLLDDLLPGERGVCGTDPEAGESVLPGSSIVVRVAKVC